MAGLTQALPVAGPRRIELQTVDQARAFRGRRLLCSELFRRNRGRLVSRRRFLRLRRLLGLLFGAETRLDQLVAQRHTHDSISLASIPDGVVYRSACEDFMSDGQ